MKLSKFGFLKRNLDGSLIYLAHTVLETRQPLVKTINDQNMAENLSSNYTDVRRGRSDFKVVIQSSILAIVAAAAIIGNGMLMFLFCRHKTLRKLPHFLIIDLSIVDLLNSVINIPVFICYSVLDIPSCRGKTFAWFVSFSHSSFILLSLSTVALQMMDRYLAVCKPNFYKANKTKTKLLVMILFKWILDILTIGLVHIPLYKIDIGKKPVYNYRYLYHQENISLVFRLVLCGCLLAIIIFGCLTLRTIREHSQAMVAAGQNENSPTARLRRKAFYTVVFVTMLFIASSLPSTINAAVRAASGMEVAQQRQIGFVVVTALMTPGAVHPFLFLWRVEDFKAKVKELKDALCGQSVQIEIQDPPKNITPKKARKTHCKTENTPLNRRTASWPEISNSRWSAKTKGGLCDESVEVEIALEQVRLTHCKKENAPCIGRSASLPDILNSQQSGFRTGLDKLPSNMLV